MIVFVEVEWFRVTAAVLSSLVAVGFLCTLVNAARDREGTLCERVFTESENERGFFGGIVWWHGLRLFHVLMWTLVAVLISVSEVYAGIVVVLDSLPGIVRHGFVREYSPLDQVASSEA
jgi:hypothetical protein